ncbi:MAG: hypothetical protein GYB65_09355 [Chloroflexi bacterium]|nr:hypothetical protein [Chloroflexota bacterium]
MSNIVKRWLLSAVPHRVAGGRVMGWLVVLIAVVGSGVLPPDRWGSAHAQGPEGTRAVVQSWLLEELGQPGLVLVSYEYEGTTWPDAGLGCPVEGESYSPGEVPGYRWTFEFGNRVSYDVHSNLDGSRVALCSAINVGEDVRLSNYRNTQFSVLVPVWWLIFPNDTQSEVVFGAQQNMLCDQPGMRVSVLGQVAVGVTADQLISQTLERLGTQDTMSERQTVGSFGRTTVIETACQDTTRVWRITAFVQYGTAYRIEQWAPGGEYESEWRERFVEMVEAFGPPDNVLVQANAGNGDTAPAPDDDTTPTVDAAELNPLPLAYIFVGDLFFGPLNSVPGTSFTNVPSATRRFLSFSPDGLFLALNNTTTGQLRGLNVVENRSPRTLAREVSPAFPPAWSPDGREIAYVVDAGVTVGEGATRMDVRAVSRNGGESRLVTTFAYRADCTSDPRDPADIPYFAEAGPGGQDNVLVWLADDKFLVSTACSSGVGLLDPADGSLTMLGADLRGGVASSDRGRFLSHTDNGLALLNFETWQRTNLNVGPDVRQVAWSTDEQSVYYTTEALLDSVTLDDPVDQARGENFFGFWPVTVGEYNVTLLQVNLETNQRNVLWGGTGRGIGHLAPAPDGSGVLFSLIPSSVPIKEIFQAGGDPAGEREAWPEPALYWLPDGGVTPRLLLYAGQPVFAPVSVGNVG